MSLMIADLVEVTTTTTGTGALSLGAAATGRRTPAAAGYTSGDQLPYRVATADGAAWEIGIGTLTGTTVSRDLVISSSNAGALVNLPAGDKVFAVVYPGALHAVHGMDGTLAADPPYADVGSVVVGMQSYAWASAVVVGYSSTAQDFSVAIGRDANAASASCVAIGYQSSVSTNGVAVGREASASGGAVAMGYSTNAGTNNVAVGYDATSTGTQSVAIGDSASATGNNTVAVGRLAQASAGFSAAIGSDSVASAVGATAWPGATAAKCSVEARISNASVYELSWVGGRAAAGATTVIDRGSQNFRLPGTASTLAMDILVVGSRSTGACYAARITGVARYNGTAVSILGTPTVTVLHDTTSGAASAAIAAGSTDNLLINVNNGDGANAWTWAATLSAAMVPV